MCDLLALRRLGPSVGAWIGRTYTVGFCREFALRTRFLRPLVLSALVLLGSFALTGCGVGDAVEESFGDQKDTPAGEFMTVGERDLAFAVLREVNRIRVGMDLHELQWSEEAADVAYDHAVDMRQRGFFSHDNPDGVTPHERMFQACIEMDYYGTENIAWRQDSPGAVVTAWMNSPSHRLAIVSPTVTHMGVGVHTGRGGPWWVQQFFIRLDEPQ